MDRDIDSKHRLKKHKKKMRIKKLQIDFRDWKTKIIMGFSLIIIFFSLTTSWILFVTFPNTVKDSHLKEMQMYSSGMAISLQQVLEEGPYWDKAISDIFLKTEEASTFSFFLVDNQSTVFIDSKNEEFLVDDDILLKNDMPLNRNQSFFTFLQMYYDDFLYTESPIEANGESYTLITVQPKSAVDELVVPAQVFGFGILLTVVLFASIVSFCCYSAALGSVKRVERSLYSFLSNSSHEMKTPVASIKLLSESIEIAEKQGKHDRVIDFANRITDSSNHLEKLIRDMLAITRTNSSFTANFSQSMNNQSVDKASVAKVIENAVNAHTSLALENNLELKTDLDENTGRCFVDLSETELLTIIDNLLTNALVYTDKGEVTLSTKVLPKEIEIRIKDTGCGISKLDSERIFERFYRVESTRVKYPQGTGLGLPLVSGSVAKARGKIKLDSELGKGTTFTITLPLYQSS